MEPTSCPMGGELSGKDKEMGSLASLQGRAGWDGSQETFELKAICDTVTVQPEAHHHPSPPPFTLLVSWAPGQCRPRLLHSS